jgi:SAM-dependent methyltransferase
MDNEKRERDREPVNPPAQFLVDHIHLLPKGKALDVASGRGRNTLYLAQEGLAVHAIDRDTTALQTLRSLAQERHLQNVTTEVVDLEAGPPGNEAFPPQHYDVVLVFLYLFRPVIPALKQTLRPGGVLVYETVLAENHLRYNHLVTVSFVSRRASCGTSSATFTFCTTTKASDRGLTANRECSRCGC